MNARSVSAKRTRLAAWDADAVPDEVYAEVERALESADSPVGIDAKRTHVLILHALDRIERRIEGDAPVAKVRAAPAAERDRGEGEARRQVRGILERTPAFTSLRAKRRESLVEGLTQVTMLASEGRAELVDFPEFVATLLQGTFEAIVEASIEQMEAYAELVREVTVSVDQFVNESRSEGGARQRQHLLATMVLMGVTRVKIGSGGIRTRTVVAQAKQDEKDE